MNSDGFIDSEIVDYLLKMPLTQRIPTATYRIQFSRDFTFRSAEALISYLYDLGVSDCYASPVLKARPGSRHGYDICDHSQLNPENGKEEDFTAFTSALKARGMGLILDMVPNHMSISSFNPWWLEVLEIGPNSNYASYFDIDWHPVKADLENKVLLPILEDQYGKVLESGKFRLTYEDGSFCIYYYETKLPLAPRTYMKILRHSLDQLTQVLGDQNEDLQELQSILTALSYLPSRTELSPEKIAERIREKEVIKRRIAALFLKCPEVRSSIESSVGVFNGKVGYPESFDLLDQLIEAQPYRPAFWRVATEEINYRRFFDINDLAAIRVESSNVFQATHQLVFRLLMEEKASGLRIDHPDGLWDPPRYFRQLQENYLLNRIQAGLAREGQAISLQAHMPELLKCWRERKSVRPDYGYDGPLYVVAEKILTDGESLPEDWALHGTTGYDFLNEVNGLFVDNANLNAFDKLYSKFTGTQTSFASLAISAKKMIMLTSMSGEINALAYQLDRISEKNRWYRDFTLNSLTFAIREVIAGMSIYRTYITESKSPSERDRLYIQRAVSEARRSNPRTARAIFDFIRDTLLLENVQDFREEDRPRLTDFVMKFEQITGPVMAKGVEDTAFYIFNRLVSLNEVGGNPEQFGITVEKFHQKCLKRLRRWPHTMLATSTHDTKRSEDVRARVNVLSEMPGEWGATLKRWSKLNAGKRTVVNGVSEPDRNDEYLLYQTLIGTWPSQILHREEEEAYRERISAYMLKATKEAKVHTSWVNPNEAYDASVKNFVRQVLEDMETSRFGKDFRAFQHSVAYYGRINSLAQALLKMTVPGIPDIYQGTERWDFSLVDPDNRRLVDYEIRRNILAELRQQTEAEGQNKAVLAKELFLAGEDGRIKLYLTYRVLNFRREHADLFAKGEYLALQTQGEKQEHVCAFSRNLEGEEIIVVVPRLVIGLTGGNEQAPFGESVWEDTRLVLTSGQKGQGFRNSFTGEILFANEGGGNTGIQLSAIFNCFPVALLERLSQDALQPKIA